MRFAFSRLRSIDHRGFDSDPRQLHGGPGTFLLFCKTGGRSVDNKIALNAGWDLEILRLELGEFGSIDVDIDLTLTGFSTGEIDVILTSPVDPDDEVIPQVPATPRTKLGDIWISGNRSGRPRGRWREAPYEAVLGQMVTIREDGVERRVTAAEAFLLHLAKRGLEGDGPAARASLAAIEERKERSSTHQGPCVIIRTILDPGSVTYALQPLRMARKLDPYREIARMALEPWLVEAALARLRGKLSPADQRTIVKATRTPHKVRWPEWWSEHP